eukprot:TRINITY_DN7620_c0_g1_i1.p1 TRINITY_DN7620_c0_g1~~TRINITY_DN7620_c0_g1_i1.p1  ORF type:complete len:205 (-),score=34.84 TRINITY_DN7620_c0_g1_i1:88-702(-)
MSLIKEELKVNNEEVSVTTFFDGSSFSLEIEDLDFVFNSQIAEKTPEEKASVWLYSIKNYHLFPEPDVFEEMYNVVSKDTALYNSLACELYCSLLELNSITDLSRSARGEILKLLQFFSSYASNFSKEETVESIEKVLAMHKEYKVIVEILCSWEHSKLYWIILTTTHWLYSVICFANIWKRTLMLSSWYCIVSTVLLKLLISI